jgi:hypothetical protein
MNKIREAQLSHILAVAGIPIITVSLYEALGLVCACEFGIGLALIVGGIMRNIDSLKNIDK